MSSLLRKNVRACFKINGPMALSLAALLRGLQNLQADKREVGVWDKFDMPVFFHFYIGVYKSFHTIIIGCWISKK